MGKKKSPFKKAKKAAKKVGRVGAKVTAKIVKPLTGVLAAAATVAFGPVAGAAIAAGGAAIARQQGATAARAKGKRGKEARAVGRKLSKQTLKIGLMATGVGTVVNAGVALASGGNVGEAVGLGQAGSKLLGSKSAPAAAAPEDGGLSTLKTEQDLYTAATNPGLKAADGGLLEGGWDSLKRFLPGGGETPPTTGPAGENNTDAPVSFLDGIPTPVKWGAAALLVVLLLGHVGGRAAA